MRYSNTATRFQWRDAQNHSKYWGFEPFPLTGTRPRARYARARSLRSHAVGGATRSGFVAALDSSHDNKSPARYCPLPVPRRGFGGRLSRPPSPPRSTLSGVRKPSLSPSPERYATGLAIIQACYHIFCRLPLTDAPRENRKSTGGGSPAPVPPRPSGSASVARACSGSSPCAMSLRLPVAFSFLAAFSGS